MPSPTLAYLLANRMSVAFRCTHCTNNKSFDVVELIAAYGENMTLADLERRLRCKQPMYADQPCNARGRAYPYDPSPPAMGVQGSWYDRPKP